MAGKRQAVKDLNHDNWNDEEEEETPGEFKKASSDILQQRIRKVAKRRGAVGSDDGNKASNPFSGFGGFNSASTTTPAANPSPFSFLAKIPASTTTSNATTSNVPKTNGELKTKPDSKTDYLSKVKALNEAFLEWIKQHVDENPLCDLTPVFRDYEKYMKEFEALKSKVSENEPKKDAPAPPASSNSFSFGKPSTSISQPPPASNNSIVFGAKTISPVKPLAPALTENKSFSFGLAAPTAASSQPFSFGLQKTSTGIGGTAPLFGNVTSTPFSFANVSQKTEASKPDEKGTGENEEESEEPPKNEFTPVVEEDSLYSKRCKVFVKTASEYADRGVGTLFLKKVEDKVQLLVRADTNLGNILINIIVSEGLPVSRMGKNNVMVVCMPMPDSKPPPVPVLLRVKTGDEADELLETINKHKK